MSYEDWRKERESWDSETPAGKHANHKLIPFHQDEIFLEISRKWDGSLDMIIFVP